MNPIGVVLITIGAIFTIGLIVIADLYTITPDPVCPTVSQEIEQLTTDLTEINNKLKFALEMLKETNKEAAQNKSTLKNLPETPVMPRRDMGL